MFENTQFLNCIEMLKTRSITHNFTYKLFGIIKLFLEWDSPSLKLELSLDKK